MKEDPKMLLLKDAQGKYHKYIKVDYLPIPLLLAQELAATDSYVIIVIPQEVKP